MMKKWMDKSTAEKIFIVSGNGVKHIKKYIPNTHRIASFMGGDCQQDLFDNPGVVSKQLNQAIRSGNIFNSDTRFLRKYFWNVDMSVPGNEFGVECSSEDYKSTEEQLPAELVYKFSYV